MAELYAMKDACVEKAIEYYRAGEYDMAAFYWNASVGFQMKIDRIPMDSLVKQPK